MPSMPQQFELKPSSHSSRGWDGGGVCPRIKELFTQWKGKKIMVSGNDDSLNSKGLHDISGYDFELHALNLYHRFI